MHFLGWQLAEKDAFTIYLERDITTTDYAILSHRWGKSQDEVSFEDMVTGKQKSKKGYDKLIGCCRQAQKDGIRYIWVDTCCINKASSAELSEAITSMFAYYEQARVCYTLLDDVTIEPALPEGSLPRGFTQSLWFTRGWTLQELIAPKLVRFFDSKWSFIGSKTDDFMLPTLVSVTNIDEIVLRVPSSTRVISISKKMSWAAKRKTTRKEYVAYCLMGIFGVFMSPLYGEGAHAFIRLQEAIMKVSNDHTIFAWTSPPTETLIHGLESVTTMLALSPSQFKDSANFQSLPHNKHNNTLQERYRLDYTSTNAGLSIRLPLLMIDEPNCLFVAFLACSDETPPVQTAILLKTSEGAPAGHFWRTSCNFGPTERHNARWLTCTGREEVTTQDIYVLPRFAPLSEVTIEPAWKQTTVTISSSEGAADKSLKLISDLHHDGEPAITQLSHLARTRYLISTGQSKEIVKQINAMRLISESLPGPRNRQYCRRLDEPQELIDKLITRKDRTQDCSPGPRICMISGMGGMGKTQMALDFCYHCLDIHMFDMIFWIPSETRHGALAAFHKLALKLELIEDVSPADLQTSKALEIVKAWMSSSGPKESAYGFDQRETRSKWPLVFDNVEDGEMIQEFMPSLGDGCILMTSRDASLGQSFQAEHIKLQPLTTTQSSHLLYKLTGLPGDLTEISKILHGYPLALAQIAKFISSRTLSLDEAIELFKVERPVTHSPGISSLLESTLSQLPPASRAILLVLAFLDPDSISNSLLSTEESMPLEAYPNTRTKFFESRAFLFRTALIERSSSGKVLRIHRLIQELTRESESEQNQRKGLATAMLLVSDQIRRTQSCPVEGSTSHSEKTLSDLKHHVIHLKRFELKPVEGDDLFYAQERFSRMINKLEERL